MPKFSPKQNEYYVYCHTNKINGKKYFGITRQKPERRWQNGAGYYKTYFGNAIKKYGWDAFEHAIIASGLNKETAISIEIALIATHKTNDRRYGYNISIGGETCDCIVVKRGINHPNHQRIKMINPQTGKVIRLFGSQSEAAEIMGICRKGITKACCGKSATYKGYIWEYADKNYIKPPNNGRGNYAHVAIQKKIKMIDINGAVYEFNSIKEAAEKLNMKRSTISRYLLGIRHDSSGRRWCHA